MYKRLRYFFIHDLEEGKNIFEASKIKIIFDLVLFAIVMTTVIVIYNAYLGQIFVSIRGGISLLIMAGMLYGSKLLKSIVPLIHVLIISAIATIFTNIFLVFQEVDYSTIALFFIVTMFGFYFLSTKWSVFYAVVQALGLLSVMYMDMINYTWTDTPPTQFSAGEQALAFVIVAILMAYLLLQFHNANERFSKDLTRSNKLLKESKESAEELSKLKTTFLANMSHEIRTPINGIMGLSELIYEKSEDEEIKQMIKMQIESSTRLLDTITSILRLSRFEVEHKKIELSVINLSHLITSSVEFLKPLASKKSIKLYHKLPDTEIKCYGTEDILVQILNNIIGNGIKFTDEGEVFVEARLEEKMSVIEVADTGVGISKEFLPKLFNAFEQESTGMNRDFEGSGLGLSISQKYIELLGGELFVESEKGLGAKFTIKIPTKSS